MSPLDLVARLVCPWNEDSHGFRQQWYRPDIQQLPEVLDRIIDDPRGRSKIYAWMKPHAIKLIQDCVEEEMVKVQKHLYFPSIESITPSFISSWSKEMIIQPVIDLAPVLTGVLLCAAESKSARGKNKTKTPDTVSPNSLGRYQC